MTTFSTSKTTGSIVLAKLINSSTEDDPKVQISYGKNKAYQISIKDIDVQTATDMEIFALSNRSENN